MELRAEITQELQNVLGELDTYTNYAPEAAPSILASLDETGEILQQLLGNISENEQAHQRMIFLDKMLKMAKEEMEAGNVEDGLWFGKSVITFLVNGTSAEAVPVEARV